MKIVLKSNPLLYYLLLLMPFIDIITGIAFNEGIAGIATYIGQIYRILLFIYLIYVLFHHGINKKLIWLLLFSLYMFILVIVHYLRFHGSLMENASATLKLLLPIYLVYTLFTLSKNKKNIVYSILDTYSWIYPLSLLLPKILGMGYAMNNYAFDSGFKGFYYANNELNVILMVLFVYCFDKLYLNILAGHETYKIKLNVNNLIKLFLITFSLLLIGSKTSIFAIFIVCIAYLMRKDNVKSKFKFIAVFLSAGVASIFAIKTVLQDQLTNMMLRLVYTYNRYALTAGFTTFLLSKRNLRIKPGVDYWYLDRSDAIVNFLFGVGKDAKCPNNSIKIDAFSLIEMDFFDCLFWFGFLATCIVIIFYLYHFIKSLSVKNLFMEKTMFVLLFLFSMTAGHILVSANSGTIFAIVTASLYIKHNDKKHKLSREG